MSHQLGRWRRPGVHKDKERWEPCFSAAGTGTCQKHFRNQFGSSSQFSCCPSNCFTRKSLYKNIYSSSTHSFWKIRSNPAPAGWWMYTISMFQIIEYYLAITRNEVLIPLMTLMNLENMTTEKSWSQKTIWSRSPLIISVPSKQIYWNGT